jgi:hypothetical protein
VDGHLGSPAGEREARILAGSVMADPLLPQTLLKALEAPALESVAVAAVAPLMQDRSFCQRTAAVLLRIMQGAAPESLAPDVRGLLLDTPAVTEAMASFFRLLAASEPLSTQLGAGLRQLVQRLRDRDEIIRALFRGPLVRAGARRGGA